MDNILLVARIVSSFIFLALAVFNWLQGNTTEALLWLILFKLE